MYIINSDKAVVACSLARMPQDLKRILRVQMKEFLHYLDEAPENSYLTDCSASKVRPIRSTSRAA